MFRELLPLCCRPVGLLTESDEYSDECLFSKLRRSRPIAIRVAHRLLRVESPCGVANTNKKLLPL